MTYSTTNTYKMKREILSFAKNISSGMHRPQQKFVADILYGMLASGSCLLTDIAQRLNEDAQKINTVDRLSRHLAEGTPNDVLRNYLRMVRKWVPSNPVVHIDDSDVVKPEGKHFYHNKWVPATELCARRKGKVKMKLLYHGAEHTAYLSHVKVQITASKKDVYLVLVYGITEHPMMLVTNRPIRSKEDVLETAQLYFSRWRIEEYFRSKKDVFDFENFRVRKLKAINALNFYIGVCMAFLGRMTMKKPTNTLHCAILSAADPIRKTVHFHYYRIAAGIRELLRHAKTGIRDWFKTKRTNQNQLRFSLAA